ncbi:cell envelope biogenesis protein OmpA [Nocardioides humilatus]|uniref:Cell envelope biogenesis protein OmpA n=1 Tax=Nocardioides humilatus TaxID=2607660 RepID=A0A5B1L4V9_9ACTN|nr:cell envelope biogenesis protein OmpA [Nocardioides humilatus]
MWKHGIGVAVAAAATTTALAAAASAAGVSFADSTGESIPVPGFATVTLFLVAIGVGIAAVMARVARRPRSTFIRTAVALVALSFVPDATFGFDVASALTLMTLHVVAAAIVVPVIAGRLVEKRR